MNDLSDDILHGAKAIGHFCCPLHWDDEKRTRRAFYLCEKRQIPSFKMGNTWCARKSKLLQWIEEQEDA